jgi:hypothetical protein
MSEEPKQEHEIKLCPMLSNSSRSGTYGGEFCAKERCMWFMNSHCAVNDIANALNFTAMQNNRE